MYRMIAVFVLTLPVRGYCDASQSMGARAVSCVVYCVWGEAVRKA